MPEPLKSLPSGKRAIVEATFREVVPARPSLEGGPSAPKGSFKPSRTRERWSKGEYFLLPFAAPLYLYRSYGLVKSLVIFMVAWIAFGQLTIWLDVGYNQNIRAEMVEAGNDNKNAMRYMGNGDEIPHQCRVPWVGDNPPRGWPLQTPEEGNNPAGWPFGKLYMFGTSCTAELGKVMFGWIGPESGIVRQLGNRYEDAMWSYAIERRLSFSYVFLGFVAFLEIVLFLPWLILWGAWQVISHLKWE